MSEADSTDSSAVHDHFIDRATLNTRAFRSLELIAEEFEATVAHLADLVRGGGRLLFCGNGGSASTASHIVNDCVGHMRRDRDPIDSLSLADNVSVLTALAKDYGYVEIFERQVVATGRPGDALIAISTSGNSENVVKAVEAARRRSVSVIALTDQKGGKLRELADHWLPADTDDPVCAEHIHLFLLHTLTESLEIVLFPDSPAWGARD